MSAAGFAADEVIDRVLAVVAGDLITLTDVTAARDLGFVSPRVSDDPVGDVLAQLIDRELILSEVERYAPPEPSADAVDRDVEAVRSRLPSTQALDAVLARSGIDEAHLRETVRQNLRIRAYLDQRFTVAPATEEELALYYQEHPAAFTRGGQLLPFEGVRSDVMQALTRTRRTTLIDDWVSGLRRRAEIVNLYLPRR